MLSKKREPSTRYFRWEGDACRVHAHENGDLTADIYRAGIGFLEVCASDVLDSSAQIGREEYEQIIKRKDEMAARESLHA